ncbi:MAG: hydroxymethylbilane synthase [Hyphomicrobiales bacterium]|nr:hydroxymethylbilane synthase [Hyphomicrobiales bacterium]
MAGTHFLRLGTRGSPLALAQAHETQALLAAAHGIAADEIEIVVIKTTGDMIQDRALSQAGGKGLFTRELDLAMLEGRIDIAVHSSKDLPTALPDEIVIGGYLAREDVRDVLICRKANAIADLPRGANVGTASLRRGAQVKRLRPDVTISLLRGNVETRLRKLDEGVVDATLLALAGLRRLGLAHKATSVLDTEDFLPAVGQGAVGITLRGGDARTRAALAPILHGPTGHALAAERAFLRVLDGSCRTPLAGLALTQGDTLRFRGMILRPDGGDWREIADEAPVAEAAAMGARAGLALREKAPADLFPLA